MATLATFFRRSDMAVLEARTAVRAEIDPWELRELPNEDVYLYAKRIDNSRVERQADPQSRRQCWTAIGAAGAVGIVLTALLAPGVGRVLAGYQVQALEAEHQRLLSERRVLVVEEAALRNPARLEELARDRNLVKPAAEQIVHLDPAGESSIALNVNSR